MNGIIESVKNFYSIGKNWIKSNGDYKVIGIAAVIGLLTFSAWASLFLAILCGGVLYAFATKVPAQFTSLINIDFKKYIINAMIGLVCGSIINLIF